ncbi:hypothetical protein ACLKA7_009976 [Drosophila subpalustris]
MESPLDEIDMGLVRHGNVVVDTNYNWNCMCRADLGVVRFHISTCLQLATALGKLANPRNRATRERERYMESWSGAGARTGSADSAMCRGRTVVKEQRCVRLCSRGHWTWTYIAFGEASTSASTWLQRWWGAKRSSKRQPRMLYERAARRSGSSLFADALPIGGVATLPTAEAAAETEAMAEAEAEAAQSWPTFRLELLVSRVVDPF